MKCKITQEQLIDYLYGEVDVTRQGHIETHLESCNDCRQTIRELQTTRSFLKQWEEETPQLNLSFVRDQRGKPGAAATVLRFIDHHRFAAGIAAGIAACFLLLALMNFQIRYQNERLDIAIGLLPTEATDDNFVTRDEFKKWQIQSVKLMDRMLQDSEEQQAMAVREAMLRLDESWDVQRQCDLQEVGKGLELFQLANQTQLQQSQEKWEQLYRYINENPNQEK